MRYVHVDLTINSLWESLFNIGFIFVYPSTTNYYSRIKLLFILNWWIVNVVYVLYKMIKQFKITAQRQ